MMGGGPLMDPIRKAVVFESSARKKLNQVNMTLGGKLWPPYPCTLTGSVTEDSGALGKSLFAWGENPYGEGKMKGLGGGGSPLVFMGACRGAPYKTEKKCGGGKRGPERQDGTIPPAFWQNHLLLTSGGRSKASSEERHALLIEKKKERGRKITLSCVNRCWPTQIQRDSHIWLPLSLLEEVEKKEGEERREGKENSGSRITIPRNIK